MISIFALVISEVIVQEHVYNVLKQSVDRFLESALCIPPSTVMHNGITTGVADQAMGLVVVIAQW